MAGTKHDKNWSKQPVLANGKKQREFDKTKTN